MKTFSKWIHIAWLTRDPTSGELMASTDADVEWQSLPDDPIYSGGYEKLGLSVGVDVYRIEINFSPHSSGELVEHGEVELGFDQPTFLAQTLKQGSKYLRDPKEEAFLPFFPGHNFFRYGTQVHYRGLLNSSRPLRAFYLTAGRETLDHLLGAELSASLLAALGVEQKRYVRRAVPQEVNTPLWETFPASLIGPMRKLHAQAKAVEYLTRLTHHLLHEAPSDASEPSRAKAIYDYLLELEGKLPSLDELATQFGRSARALNEEFCREHGKPIVTFISEQRLEQAHQAILESDVPLKIIAHRLGYSQVGHFSTAFRRKFGYAPGTLRRGDTQDSVTRH